MKYYIKGNYYFDIDAYNQLRITGPQNHLLIGMPFPHDLTIEVLDYIILEDNLVITLACEATSLELDLPLVTDIRTLRQYTEDSDSTVTYETLSQNQVDDLLPKIIDFDQKKSQISFKNAYQDGDTEKEYGTCLSVLNGTVEQLSNAYRFTANRDQEKLLLKIRTLGNIEVEDPHYQVIFTSEPPLEKSIVPKTVKNIFDKVKPEIEHLLTTKKTSSFEYGTIFPRDWIESADLGLEDFTIETIDYMYRQSMKHVSEIGEGWHEELVGQYKTKFIDKRLHVDRKMIDIEPHYILGFPHLSSEFKQTEEIKHKLKTVAAYVIHNADQFSLITFKPLTESPQEYHHVGNWRDSYLAFGKQISPLAPYDVNCVFYPVALKVLLDNLDYFELDAERMEKLIQKWDQNKIKFRLYHENLIGYCLAIHSKKRLPIPIAHLDESYDLFYGSPSMEEVVSFAQKVIDPEYFYTPVGPVLVSRDDPNFSTAEYHGKVIWPKQAAYAVAGLAKQFFKGKDYNWPSPVLQEIQSAAITTAEACFAGWEQLGVVPELYYYDEIEDRARLYTDQTTYEGQMSLVQLWSAVGCRRIVREYVKLKSIE